MGQRARRVPTTTQRLLHPLWLTHWPLLKRADATPPFTKQACVACTVPDCPLGARRVACAPDADASCEPCAQLSEVNTAYVTLGACDVACASGFYFAEGWGCVPCSTYMCTQPSFRRSTDCVPLQERAHEPTCVPCPAAPAGARFVAGCAHVCTVGFIPAAAAGGGCLACNASLMCDWGTELSCDGLYAACSPCPEGLPGGRVYVGKGSCDSACAPGTLPPDCILPPDARVPTPPPRPLGETPPPRPARRADDRHSSVPQYPWFMG